MIYLDNAATTMPKPDTVKQAVLHAMDEAASAGRSAHKPAMRAAEILFDARQTAAELFGVENSCNVVFTGSATAALNTAIFSMAEHCRHFAITGMEHNAVVRPLHFLQQKGIRVTILPTVLWDDDRLLEAAEDACRHGADCFVVCHVSNVFGWRLPVERLSAVLARHHVPMIVDASQSAGICLLDVRSLPSAVAVAMPGHKGLYGPQGTGILLWLAEKKPRPLLFGGTGSRSMEAEMPEELPDRLEAGTHAIPAIAGLAEGMRLVQSIGVENIGAHERALRRELTRQLQSIPGVHCLCSPWDERQTGVLSIVCDGMDTETLSQHLAEHDICVRSGLHCAPLAHQTTGTLATGTVRLSPGCFQTEQEMQETADTLQEILL